MSDEMGGSLTNVVVSTAHWDGPVGNVRTVFVAAADVVVAIRATRPRPPASRWPECEPLRTRVGIAPDSGVERSPSISLAVAPATRGTDLEMLRSLSPGGLRHAGVGPVAKRTNVCRARPRRVRSCG